MGGDLLRLAWYTAVRAALLVLAVAVEVQITVVIAAMGRQLDKVGEVLVRGEAAAILEPLRSQLKPEKYREMYNTLVEQKRRECGLDRPWAHRSLRHLVHAIILSFTPSSEVRHILLEAIPDTFAPSSSLSADLPFHCSFLAPKPLQALRKNLRWPRGALGPPFRSSRLVLRDRPHRLILAGVAVGEHGGRTPCPRSLGRFHLPGPPPHPFGLRLVRGRNLPGKFSRRTFFLLSSMEDCVKVAKDTPRRILQRRHVLRPAFPRSSLPSARFSSAPGWDQ